MPRYQLYAHKNSYAMSTHLMLEELSLEYDIVWFDVHNPNDFPSDFLKINPNGRVPVLITPNGPIYESAAILIHLAENHGNQFLPSSGRARDKAMQWLMYLMSTLQPEVLIQFNAQRYFPKDIEMQRRLKDASLRELDSIWQVLEGALHPGPWFLGATYSICDMLFVMQGIWRENQPENLNEFPRAVELMRNTCDREAARKILQIHNIEHLAKL